MEKKKRKKYRPFIRFVIGLGRVFTRRQKVVGKCPDSPCVYLVRHLDTGGVIGSFKSIPVVMRPWVLDIFHSYDEAKRQFKDYTFSVRMKKSKAFCAVVSPIAARFLVSLVHSANSIPVYRGDKALKTITTIRESVKALENEDNLLIFPDVEYADVDDKSGGEIYKGFIAVDKLYFKRTGSHVKFVPVFMSKKKVVIHPPVTFEEGREDETYAKIVDGIYNESLSEE